MKKNTLAFILPSLLSGCTGIHGGGNAPSDTPALVFVDGQIRESAGILALTQQRLTPPPVTPMKRVSVSPATPPVPVSKSSPLPSPILTPSFSRLTISGQAGGVPVTFTPTARNRTVSDWIRTLLPSGWQFRQENAATPKLNSRLVSWSANDQWVRSLNRLLEEQHLWGHLDWNARTLTVTTSATPPAPEKPVAVPAVPLTTATDTPAASTATQPLTTTGKVNDRKIAPEEAKAATATTPSAPRNPFRGDNTAVSVSGTTGGTPAGTAIQSKKQAWTLARGTLLRAGLEQWVVAVPCQAGGTWQLAWQNPGLNYSIDAPLHFTGDFRHALSELFRLYQDAQTPLYAAINSTQCVVHVSDRPGD